MEFSPRLSLSYLSPSQAQKHVTVNESFRLLDALVQPAVLSQSVSAEPGSPNEGDAYILPASPTGTDWGGFSQHSIAVFQDGAWVEIVPSEGFVAWVNDDDALYAFDGSLWVSGANDVGPALANGTYDKIGVNVAADATNRFSVKSNAVLFDALDVSESGNGDSQIKVNKEASGDTASHLFQVGFSGRAEFGLTGDDDFHIKVSPDNFSTTYDSITIDKDTGNIGVFESAPDGKLHISSTSFDTLLKLERTTGGAAGDAAFNFENGVFTLDLSLSTDFRIRENGAQHFRIYDGGGVQVGNPTGGDKGGGAINAEAVYDDNTLLSCYVFDQAIDGQVDVAKWDANVPDRIIQAEINDDGAVIKPAEAIVRSHDPLRKFAARIGTEYDPLTLDGYAKHWKEKRHLTAMPNETNFDPEDGMAAGEWIQRLVETVEVQAVLLEKLNERVKALEGA